MKSPLVIHLTINIKKDEHQQILCREATDVYLANRIYQDAGSLYEAVF